VKVPMICRIMALGLLSPIVLCIGLELIAYGTQRPFAETDSQPSPGHCICQCCRPECRGHHRILRSICLLCVPEKYQHRRRQRRSAKYETLVVRPPARKTHWV
jgi:hypothetical protein